MRDDHRRHLDLDTEFAANPAKAAEVELVRQKRSTAAVEPLLLAAADLAELLRVSTATIWRLRAAGKLPRPMAALGRQLVRWERRTVESWVAAGMPCLKDWEAMKGR